MFTPLSQHCKKQNKKDHSLLSMQFSKTNGQINCEMELKEKLIYLNKKKETQLGYDQKAVQWLDLACIVFTLNIV